MKNISLLFIYYFSITLVFAQEPYAPDQLTEEDYSQAENALSYNTFDKVRNLRISPIWAGEKFIYLWDTEDGFEIISVNARNKDKSIVLTEEEIKNQLSEIMDESSSNELPNVYLTAFDGSDLNLRIGRGSYTYDLNTKLMSKLEPKEIKQVSYSSISPDKTKAVYIKDHNLWVQDLMTDQRTQLTFDGMEDFGYATNNAGWTKRPGPVLLWSPDSKKIATFQHDGRGVGEMYMVTTNVGHPKLEAWKYPLPGDSLIFRIHRIVVDVENAEIVRLDMPPDMHRSSVTDHVALRGGRFADVAWSEDGEHMMFLSSSRDHKEATLRVANAKTGEVRDVHYEKEETFFESGYRAANWRFLPKSNAFIWYSQQSDWGHLYLYHLETGKLNNAITSGDWNVAQVLHLDEEDRTVYFTGVGREHEDPYYFYLYKVGLDGQNLTLLTPENANHSVTLSDDADYFVDNYSTPQTPPIFNLRDNKGNLIMEVGKSDIDALVESGWQPPMNIKVKARDGETDLFGLLHKPKNFDPKKKYPVINYIYPGPQSGSVGSRSFSPSRRDNQAIADLGFIVMSLDAMGTPLRSKSFHEAYYGNMGDNGLPDQISGMEQLAEKYAWIDLERAGIYGHSGGGFASTDAILRYPDFFKVAVSGAGNHDNRNYEDDWGEKWQGLLVQNEDGTTNYDNQANQLLVENLKGKLMLAHGTMDGNVPVYNTLLVADRLMAANKDFDLVLFPNRGHGFANEPYMLRKRWDYFVQNLLGATPPKEYKFRQIRRP